MKEEKKALSAKEYLSQIQDIDTNIQQDLEQLEAMITSAASTGAIDYSKDKVQTSPRDKLSDDVSRYVDFNEYINQEIDRFVDIKNQIISEIRKLHNVKYNNVLFKVYVQYKTLQQVAEEMKLSYSYVLELHKNALTAFEKTYKNLQYYT